LGKEMISLSPSSPQNRAYQSPGTRLKQSTYPKRRTDAVNLPVAVVVHQPEIREVIRPSVTLGLHVVDVDLFPIVQSLMADQTEPVLPPGELLRRPVMPWVLCRRWLQ
jgi:hypothetical protein